MKICSKTGRFERFAMRRKNFKVEEKIEGGMAGKQLSFSYPLEDGQISCEQLIEYGEDRFRVKEAPVKGRTGSVVAEQDRDALSGHAVTLYKAEGGLLQCVEEALSGTGWTCVDLSAGNAGSRSLEEKNTNSLELLEKIAEIFWVELSWNAKKKIVYLHSRIGSRREKAVFTEGYNLKALEAKTDTHSFFTRIYPIGKDGLTIAGVNEGREYLENHAYSAETRTCIWESTEYTDAAMLKKAAEKKLEELARPRLTYTAQILDLDSMADGYGEYAYSLGDEVKLVDSGLGINAWERIVRTVRYPDHPEKNSIELSNQALSFAQLQKKLLASAEIVKSLTGNKKGVIVDGTNINIDAAQVEGLEPYYTTAITNLEIDSICR